jgi:hypothetical protein
MGLFGTKQVQAQENTIRDCIKMIEAFFKGIGFNPKEQRLPHQDTLGWWLQRGSALVYIILNQHDDTATVRIVSPILYLPENYILPFYRKCLEMNVELINCAFGVVEDRVVLVSERPIDGLDRQELEGTIRYLSAVADDLDDKLATEFKARLYLGRGREIKSR